MIFPSIRRCKQIGIDRRIRLNWLERTTNLLLAGNDVNAIKIALQEDIRGAFRSNNTKIRGSLNKTITILMKIWVRPPHYLNPLKQEGLRLVSCLSKERHIVVHWGMTMAVYPFWAAVAAYVGRLLRLQGTVSVRQVQRRIWEQYGERDTVSRAVQRVIRSFVDWQVLTETSKRGLYTSGLLLNIDHVRLIAWLIECFLYTKTNNFIVLETIFDSTTLFPFRLNVVPASHLIAVSKRLNIINQGIGQNLIMLHQNAAIHKK